MQISGLIGCGCRVSRRLSKFRSISSSSYDRSESINVSTYNVLSSHLCEPNYFIKCDENHLDPVYRFAQLKSKLDNEISMQSVICLQEVSGDWAGRLHSYFVLNKYYFITGLYGNQFDGRMGVGKYIYRLLHAI